MQKSTSSYIGLFIIIVLIQVFVLDQIEISGYINPFFYVFFILILPFDISKYILLILAFVLGLTIDIFSDTAGMHTSATVLMAFLRPGVINTTSIKKEFESGSYPGLHNMDTSWVVTYSLILILCHHTFLFFLEAFSFSEFFTTLWRSVLSSLVTFVFVMIGFFFEGRPKRRK